MRGYFFRFFFDVFLMQGEKGEGKEKGGEPHHNELSSPHSSRRVPRILVREREVPVRGREAAKGADEAEEDEEEDDVGPQGADEEDEADESCAWADSLALALSYTHSSSRV